MPACEEQLVEWELDEKEYLEPEDQWYVDDRSGKVLPDDLVQEARLEELKFADKIQLWGVLPRPPEGRVIGTRWVDVSKGDEDDYLVRSRLVGQEIKKHSGTIAQYVAAMPLLCGFEVAAIATSYPRSADDREGLR